MPQPNPKPVLAVSRQALRIVLFGMPDAGKSSLLGALVQAAQTQDNVLGGKLIDKTHGLMELQRRLYEDRPRETLDEVVSFPVALESLPSPKSSPAAAVEAILFDCDGRVANDLLTHKDALTSNLSQTALAKEVLGADTLVLPVDVAGEELQRDFLQFSRFLRLLEQSRGQRAEVGGLPVYLVLTKCDLVAKPDDSTAAWIDRIEDHKRQVHQRFQEFLAEEAERSQLPFGKIELHVWATAVKRPPLTNAPARPREPYGVAELFRQCLDSAAEFRQRQSRASQRLAWTLSLVAGLVGFMALLALFFLASQRESELSRFERELKSYCVALGDSSAQRLQEPLTKTIKDLAAFRDHPLFDKMPQDLQNQVLDQLREAEAYDEYSKQWQASIKSARLGKAPRFAQNEAELKSFDKLLLEHPIPAEYQTAWDGTDLARRQREWKDDIEAMRREVKAALAALDELIALAGKYEKEDSRKLREALGQELKWKDKSLPYREGNRAVVPNSARVTYEDVLRFETVNRLYSQWQKMREQLKLDAP